MSIFVLLVRVDILVVSPFNCMFKELGTACVTFPFCLRLHAIEVPRYITLPLLPIASFSLPYKLHYHIEEAVDLFGSIRFFFQKIKIKYCWIIQRRIIIFSANFSLALKIHEH